MTALSVVETAPRSAGPAAYPDDLGPGMQAELAALADIETRFDGVVAHLGRRPAASRRTASRARARAPGGAG
jgi:hypothetical protein